MTTKYDIGQTVMIPFHVNHIEVMDSGFTNYTLVGTKAETKGFIIILEERHLKKLMSEQGVE